MTINQRLAAGAFVLGAVALFAQPMRGRVVSLDAQDLAREMIRDEDRVAPRDLADWIVQGRTDFRLIDVRDAEAFAAYHIPGAEHVAIGGLAEAGLLRNERIVVYADEGSRAAQAWFLLKGLGYPGVSMLRDGLEGWQREVLFPTLAENPTPFEAQRNAKLVSLARHFGGQPRSAGAGVGDATPAMTLPTVPTMPAAPSGAPLAGGPKRKKKEGC